VLAWALLAAMLLGALHAFAPGHGKTVVGAYLIGSRASARHAAFLGLTVTITHTLGVFALGFATLVASSFIVPERLLPALSFVSGALVLAIGMWLLVARLHAASSAARTRYRLSAHAHRQSALVHSHGGKPHSHGGALHSHGGTLHSHGGSLHSHLPAGAAGEKVTWKSLVTLGVSGGLVPCPSAMALLLAAIALNKTAYGMLLVLAFSLGLAGTLTAIGLVFLYARDRLGARRIDPRWRRWLPVASAAVIAIVGVAMCYGAIVSAPL
jgi:ABC-type nickel/cobalt efflux system permease component RcnA